MGAWSWFIGHLFATLPHISPPFPSLFQLVSSSKCCQSHSSLAVFMLLSKGCCHMITMSADNLSGGDLGFLLWFPSAARDKSGSCCDRHAGRGDYCDRSTCFVCIKSDPYWEAQTTKMAWWEAARKTVHTSIHMYLLFDICGSKTFGAFLTELQTTESGNLSLQNIWGYTADLTYQMGSPTCIFSCDQGMIPDMLRILDL